MIDNDLWLAQQEMRRREREARQFHYMRHDVTGEMGELLEAAIHETAAAPPQRRDGLRHVVASFLHHLIALASSLRRRSGPADAHL